MRRKKFIPEVKDPILVYDKTGHNYYIRWEKNKYVARFRNIPVYSNTQLFDLIKHVKRTCWK